MLEEQKCPRCFYAFVVVLLILTLNPKFGEFSCVENDCYNNGVEEINSKQKKESKDMMPFIDLLPSEADIGLIREISEFPFEYVLKSSPDIKSLTEFNPNSTPLLPVIEKIAKKTKQNLIKKYRDFKRTEGNRNFQTQGWK